MMEVPEGWKVKTINDIAKVSSGGTPSRERPEFWNGDIPWVRTTEVQNCKIYHHNIQEFISEEGLKNSSAKIFPKNTLLLAMIGQGKTRGQVALLMHEAATNQNCSAIILNSNHCSVFYFNHLLSQYQNIRNYSNSAGQSNLSGSLIKTFKVPVPPAPEQQKIAEILSTWDRAIEATESLIQNSQAQKKALMQQLLTGKKRLKGFSEEWEEIEFGKLGETYSGLSGKTKKDFGKGRSYIPYKTVFKYPCVNFSFLDKVNIEKDEKQNIAQHGDIIFTTSSETPEEVGMSSVVVEPLESLYLNSFCFGFRPENLSQLTPLFAAQYFRSPYMRRLISSLAQGSTRYNLSKKGLMKLKLTLPSLKEQTAIAEILSTADRETELLTQKLGTLKQEKSALMQQLLTGKRRVKIDDKAVAA